MTCVITARWQNTIHYLYYTVQACVVNYSGILLATSSSKILRYLFMQMVDLFEVVLPSIRTSTYNNNHGTGKKGGVYKGVFKCTCILWVQHDRSNEVYNYGETLWAKIMAVRINSRCSSRCYIRECRMWCSLVYIFMSDIGNLSLFWW